MNIRKRIPGSLAILLALRNLLGGKTMRTKTVRNIKYAIMATFIVLAVSGAKVSAQEALVDAEGNKITGTWNVAGTIVNCADGSPLPVQIRGLNAFTQGGVMMELAAGLPPATRTPGLGVWEHVKGRNYVGTLKAFRFENNTPAGKSIIIADIRHELNDTLTIRVIVTNFNDAGDPVGMPICINSVGTRFTGED